MEVNEKTVIRVHATVGNAIDYVWKCWTTPNDIVKWNYASDDWHTPRAENEFRVGGKFNYRMEARDGTFGFDFNGVYDRIKVNELIEYTLDDGRKVSIIFHAFGNKTEVVETFEVEDINSLDLQRDGWQAILDNFKKYIENNS